MDFYRVSGVVLIVPGHWLAGSVTYHDGQFGRQNPLVDLPWTQWLTWLFPAVPIFFLAAGYAGAVSWTHRRDTKGASRPIWLSASTGPGSGADGSIVALVAVIVMVVAAFRFPVCCWNTRVGRWRCICGASPSNVVVVSLTPIAVAAQRRWGLLAPAALAAGGRGGGRHLGSPVTSRTLAG